MVISSSSTSPQIRPGQKGKDVAYRTGLILQMLGTALLAILYPLRSPFYSAGIMVFELGTLLSAITLSVRSSWIKMTVLAALLIGIPLQVYGALSAAPETAGTMILAGIGLSSIAAAGMAGKEAYCFSFREGWAIMLLLPSVIIVNFVGPEHILFNSLGFSALFLLFLSLVGRKLKKPHPSPLPSIASSRQVPE